MKIEIIKSSDADNYDEYQKSIMHKCASQALVVLMALILINATLKTIVGREWAMPLIEGSSLIYVALIYYLTSIFIKGAYVPFNNKKVYTLLIGGLTVLFAAAVQLALLMVIYRQKGVAGFYKDGALHDFSLLAISAIFMFYLALLMILAWRAGRKEFQSGDED